MIVLYFSVKPKHIMGQSDKVLDEGLNHNKSVKLYL